MEHFFLIIVKFSTDNGDDDDSFYDDVKLKKIMVIVKIFFKWTENISENSRCSYWHMNIYVYVCCCMSWLYLNQWRNYLMLFFYFLSLLVFLSYVYKKIPGLSLSILITFWCYNTTVLGSFSPNYPQCIVIYFRHFKNMQFYYTNRRTFKYEYINIYAHITIK